MQAVSVIVATTPNGGIGKDRSLQWGFPENLGYFDKVTTDTGKKSQRNAVVMSRKVWKSISEHRRPLVGRLNVVLTRLAREPGFVSPYPDGVLVAESLHSAMEMLASCANIGEIFVMGGQTIYKQALEMPSCGRVYLTRLGIDFDCDVLFPSLDESEFSVVHVSTTRSHEGVPYDFVVYERRRFQGTNTADARLSPALVAIDDCGQFFHEEYQYLNAIREIIVDGIDMDDNAGCIRSSFGQQMRFDLRSSFPLVTTKRVFWHGIIDELLWFVRGDTNGKHLFDKSTMWGEHKSKAVSEKRGVRHREVGDLGPVYGFQWRHLGAKYVDMHTDYTGHGVDQLAECIRKLKEDPTDQGIVLSACNPAELGQMACPPCHMFCQFYVEHGELSCLMYQRSCDMGIGVPWNIASYSLLTCMVAQVCGLRPGDFIHTLGVGHIYRDHVDALEAQLGRTPYPFPTVRMNPNVTDIDSFQAADFELVGYNPHGEITMKVPP
eukprot:TRINITY_DN75191_c0_g1_i1.p1 TRINITY_DN75191_c0_g1~~TRINITY_DN75191_c0_g1_i1.p1  ORF type:complete len:492 (-),score=65.19 TRINITY_DN75191_c0_g1_i1:36-1511(-)